MEAAIKDAWTNEKHPCAFTSVASVYKFVKRRFPRCKLEQVEKTLQDLESFTLHRPNVSRFPRRATRSIGMYCDLQADLADMSKYKSKNDGVTFLLNVIDIYSRRLFVKPLQSKHGVGVAKAFQEIFNEMSTPPLTVYSDDGKEFYNANVKRLFDKLHIKLASPKSEIKCAVIERANRTLKTRLAKYMTEKYNHRYIDVLPKIVKGINNSFNRGIGAIPNQVKQGDFPIPIPRRSSAKIKFSVGDHVRTAAKKAHFDKGYEQGWTTEVYVVKQVLAGHPVTYRLVDTNGEPIVGIFYTRELTKCTYAADAVYRVETVLRTEMRNGRRQHFVKWDGYDSSHNSWIDANALLNL
ncbi:hypothetical protein CRE_19557 [Caenorhabditis remanei]|uniref:Integrase catalytic domain-containing protein n=1 Tax=Caenorhabditis remanei TaxID=31234 RepID=E3NLG1_CAERE|nr:hypothetical protein CRE_19557 [Caenorhabditis remanei]